MSIHPQETAGGSFSKIDGFEFEGGWLPLSACPDPLARQKALHKLEESLGYVFGRLEILNTALAHKSTNAHLNNERLEFLGDAILNAVTSRLLFLSHPSSDEGVLTRQRARMVSGPSLVRLAQRLSLQDCLWHQAGTSLVHTSKRVLENAFEAVVAAVYLDGGWAEACRVLEGLLEPEGEVEPLLIDPKTMLQEILQANGLDSPVYALLGVKGRSPREEFEVRCQCSLGEASGSGGSKKEAERASARALVLELLKQHEHSDSPSIFIPKRFLSDSPP